MINSYFLNPQKLPLVFEPNFSDKSFEKLLNFAESRRDFLCEQLLQYGAVLLRGFQARTIEEFENFVRCFSGREFFNYAGGVSPRLALSSGVYTSTEYPAHLSLALHNELSYSAVFPRNIYFFCQTAPTIGGETTIGCSRRILQNIDPKTVELFKQKNVRYDRNLCADQGSGYSWQEAFETEDQQQVESFCQKIGAEFEWKETKFLRISQTRPATTKHPETNEEVWFNQADGFHPSNLDEETRNSVLSNQQDFRLNCCFGDGSPIPLEMLENIRAAVQKETIPHVWQLGDILILDNILTAHGRMPFSGKRKIALAMT